MQSNFLSFYHAIHQQKFTAITGLWLVHGDDDLARQWVVELCKPLFTHNSQLIKRLEINGQKSWQEIITELQSQSLFSDNTAIIATGSHKPNDDTLKMLQHFADDCRAGNSQHALIWLLPKQDKKAQSTKAFKLFSEHGNIIDSEIYNERTRQDLLGLKANEFSLKLNDGAWQTLISHTEGNLLAAYQALWRLSFGDRHDIDEQLLMDALVSDSVYNVFNLSDAILRQDIHLSLKILHELKRLDVAPSLILWAFNKDIQAVQGLMAGIEPIKLGIWQNKITLYERLKYRLSQDQLNELSTLLYDSDKSIKGLSAQSVWLNFQKIALLMCHAHA